jgi:hypothetical protein
MSGVRLIGIPNIPRGPRGLKRYHVEVWDARGSVVVGEEYRVN